MFAPAMRRLATLSIGLCAALGAAGCGGGERQDENEPEGTFEVEVVDASFPASQSIADSSKLSLRVRNPGQKALPHVAVTVQTRAPESGGAPVAFAQNENDSRLSAGDRPIWIVDTSPSGGTTAFANTWALGSLRPGQSKTFEWEVTAVKAGDYTIDYRVFPGLDGKARTAEGSRASGSFEVSISDEPVPARVDDNGEVVRGEEAAAGAD